MECTPATAAPEPQCRQSQVGAPRQNRAPAGAGWADRSWSGRLLPVTQPAAGLRCVALRRGTGDLLWGLQWQIIIADVPKPFGRLAC